MRILLTGAAGFIGAATSLVLLQKGHEVVGVDNLNDYYDVALKHARLARLSSNTSFAFFRTDIADRVSMESLFRDHAFDAVVHLAAQAGVRYSLSHPQRYIDSNLVGFGNILEGSRQTGAKHLIFASTSSVYGANTKEPFAEQDPTGHPLSLYAATKRANELMAHSYAHLFALPCTGLRFFSVYGPWGRPDMALFQFTKSILEDKSIEVYNHGQMQRNFTYVEDVAEAISCALEKKPVGESSWTNVDQGSSVAPFRIYNLGHPKSIGLLEMIAMLEDALGKKAICNLVPMHPADIIHNFADTIRLEKELAFCPRVPFAEGVKLFVQWYKGYYAASNSR